MAGYVGLAVIVALVAWRLFLAYLVLVDADRRLKANRLFLGSNLVWVIATLAFGVFAVLAYWTLHYSILVAKPNGGRSRAPVD